MNKHDLVDELARMHSLLALARELLQANDPEVALDLVGRALADLMHMDNAVLAVHANGAEYVHTFDHGGRARRSDASEPLYRAGLACLKGAGSRASLQTAGVPARGGTLLAVGVPPHQPMTALLVEWDHDGGAPDVTTRRRLLTQVAELAAAALGRLHARASLAQQMSQQSAQMMGTAQAHAAELARRDDVEHEIRELSLTDVMTGLRNRRGFFVEAEQAFKVAHRQHAASAVIFADIDGLKHVNDAIGHEAGDQLIRDAAGILRASFRNADVVARLGGDEFAAFTLDDEKPETVVARIRRNLHAFNLMEGRSFEVSLSIGIVQCNPATAMTLDDYIHAADAQMYAHKQRRLH
ncbi:MAG: diguanylate cyclase domain-containing protein [Telluria sp.]